MNATSRHKLILLTAGFPFGGGETFLESEIGYLSKAFDEVLILSGGIGKKRELPANCAIRQIDTAIEGIEKIKALRGIFHPVVREELKIIRKVYKQKITKRVLFTMLISLRQACKIEQVCQDYLPQNDSQKVFFYSYWSDDKALGIAFLQKNNPQIVTFSRIHGWDVYFEASGIGYLPFRHFLAQNLKKIFAISSKGKNYTEVMWKIPNREKISVSRLGVEKQERAENPPSIFTLVSCSNLIRLKRVHLIIEALSLVKDLEIKWMHFGDGVLYNTLLAMAQQKLKDNISFDFRGRVSNSEVLKFYRENHTDLFINVSSTEGIPVSIMEVMSFGIPVIATHVGGTSEIVNNENGFLLSADPTSSQIAETIRQFGELTEESKKQLRAKAIKTWEEKYNANRNYSAFVAQVKQL